MRKGTAPSRSTAQNPETSTGVGGDETQGINFSAGMQQPARERERGSA